jgi:hypothetical protein
MVFPKILGEGLDKLMVRVHNELGFHCIMAAQDSNLATIGYNLVCAITQAAINQTMESYVANLGGTIDEYTVYDFNTGKDSVMTAAQFANICNSVNPLAVPDGTTQPVNSTSNDDLNTLYRAGFKYGIQAVTGIDSSWTSTPDIVVLSYLGQNVTYNMYFGTMQVVELDENYGTLSFTNCSQPADAPWIFSYLVNLGLDTVTGQPGAPPPQSDLFSVQHLYVDLTEATGHTYPSISANLSAACINYIKTIIDAYVKTIPAGQSVISYQQTQVQEVTSPSITVTNLQFASIPKTESSPAMLNYLCMSNYAEPPKTIKFPQWSWLGSDDTSSGVMAVQRETFGKYLVGILNAGFDLLSAQTDGKAKYTDQIFNCTAEFDFQYTCPPAHPAVWGYISTDQTLANAS